MAHPCTGPGSEWGGHLHRRHLGALVRAGIPARIYSRGDSPRAAPGRAGPPYRWRDAQLADPGNATELLRGDASRSEERRVGKSVDRRGRGIIKKKKRRVQDRASERNSSRKRKKADTDYE